MQRLVLFATLYAASVSAQTALVVPGLVAGARFGQSVAGDGTCGGEPYAAVAVVGAPHGTPDTPATASGTVHSFRRTGGAWALAATAASPAGTAGDLFGFSVDVQPCEFHGTLVGAPGVGTAYQFPSGLSGGHRRMNGDALGPGSDFGWAVVGVGGSLHVGAPGASGGAGRVAVFNEYGNSGPPVLPVQMLAPSDPADRRFGAALAMHYGPHLLPGQFNHSRVAVGAPGDGGPGVVYIYGLTGPQESTEWVETARIAGPPGFGTALALNGVLAVTSPSTGEVLLYEEAPDGAWAQVVTITAPDDVPAGRLGATDVVVAPSNGSVRSRVVVSAATASGSGPLSPPLAFLHLANGTYDPRPIEVYGAVPSGLYGAALAATRTNVGYFIVGDPEAESTGAAFVADVTALPVASGDPPAPPATVAVQAFPQPASAVATLRVMAPGAAVVTVADLLGRTVWQARTLGPADLALDTSRLPSGLYSVRVESARQTATARLVVAH